MRNSISALLILVSFAVFTSSVFATDAQSVTGKIHFLHGQEFRKLSHQQQRDYVMSVIDLLRDLNGRNLNVSEGDRRFIQDLWSYLFPQADADDTPTCVLADSVAGMIGPNVHVKCANSSDDAGGYESYLDEVLKQYDKNGQNVYQFLSDNKTKGLPGVLSYAAYQQVNAMPDAQYKKVMAWMIKNNPDNATSTDPDIKSFLDRNGAQVKVATQSAAPAPNASTGKIVAAGTGATAFPDMSKAVSVAVDPKVDLKPVTGPAGKPCEDGFTMYSYAGAQTDMTGCVRTSKAQGWRQALDGNGFSATTDSAAIKTLNSAIKDGSTTLPKTALQPDPKMSSSSPQIVGPESIEKEKMAGALCIFAGFVIRKTVDLPSKPSAHQKVGNPYCKPVSQFLDMKCPPPKGDKRAVVLCNPLLFGTKPDDSPFCIEPTSKATESCWLVARRAYKGKTDAVLDKAIQFFKKYPDEANSLSDALSNLCNKDSSIYATDTNTAAARKFEGDIAKTCALFADRMADLYKRAPELKPADPAAAPADSSK